MEAGIHYRTETLELESVLASHAQLLWAVETGFEDQTLPSSRGLVVHWQNFLPKMEEDMKGNRNTDRPVGTEVLGWHNRLVSLHGEDAILAHRQALPSRMSTYEATRSSRLRIAYAEAEVLPHHHSKYS
jgi:hypothetical protein